MLFDKDSLYYKQGPRPLQIAARCAVAATVEGRGEVDVAILSGERLLALLEGVELHAVPSGHG